MRTFRMFQTVHREKYISKEYQELITQAIVDQDSTDLLLCLLLNEMKFSIPNSRYKVSSGTTVLDRVQTLYNPKVEK